VEPGLSSTPLREPRSPGRLVRGGTWGTGGHGSSFPTPVSSRFRRSFAGWHRGSASAL